MVCMLLQAANMLLSEVTQYSLATQWRVNPQGRAAIVQNRLQRVRKKSASGLKDSFVSRCDKWPTNSFVGAAGFCSRVTGREQQWAA